MRIGLMVYHVYYAKILCARVVSFDDNWVCVQDILDDKLKFLPIEYVFTERDKAEESLRVK